MKSIRIRLFAATCAITLAFIAIISVLNLTLYDDYYLYTRKETLSSFVTNLNDTYNNKISSVRDEINQMEIETGLRMSIFTESGGLVYDTMLYGESTAETTASPYADPVHYLSNLRISLLALQSVDQTALAAGEHVYVTVADTTQGGDYLCIVGKVGEDIAIARIPYAYMEENMSFNALFLLIASSATMLVCLVLAYFYARRFTQPLIQMNTLASNMANLDFSEQYNGTAQDEVGQLGHALNTLSLHLECAIGELQASNAQLHNQVEEKERIDAHRREFIINVSHELKTPIALVQGYAEGLQAGIADSPEDRAYYCQTIVDEALRMNHMVSELLSLSKLEDGYITATLAEIDLTALFQSVIDKTAVLWQEKSLQLFSPEQAVYAVTDATLLLQVMDNYFTNAIRYTPQGGQVVVEIVPQADNTVMLSVSNQGENIPPEELPRLWDKFYRTDKARSRDLGGTGIGLSIVRATAELLGAHYGADNIEGGMRFWLHLPALVCDKQDEEQA